jgi:RNA polymerase sigma-70 factor (ECF subfamily)
MDSSIDRVELTRLYQRYGTAVCHRARRLLGDDAAARDVCHDVFVEILRARPAWAPRSPVAWLYTTVTNKCLNRLRSGRRFARALRAHAPVERSAPELLPLAVLLRDLPEELQEIAVYYGLDEMSQEEIALVLGVSQKTVSNRIHEIRARLGENAQRQVEAK